MAVDSFARLLAMSGGVKTGYYYNGQFYSDAAHTTQITPNTKQLYMDATTHKLYKWTGTAYVATGSGGSSVSVSASGTSTSDVRYITIDGTESRFATTALRAMKSTWTGSTITTQEAAELILSDSEVVQGDGFLATVYWSDLPGGGVMSCAEVKAFVLQKSGNSGIVQFECTSADVSPYSWFYNSYASGPWRANCTPVIDNVTSTATASALSANQGKVLQTEIDNLKSIGRFLSIWDCTAGYPTTQPSTIPYTYKTGDYYRVGVVGGGRYFHQVSLAGVTDGDSYAASFGFIATVATAYSEFSGVASKLYDLGYVSYDKGLECSWTIGSTTATDGFIASTDGTSVTFYTSSGTASGTATAATTVTDTTSLAYIHKLNSSGTVAGKQYSFYAEIPTNRTTEYTTVAEVISTLKNLNYSADYPCPANGLVASTAVGYVYGYGNVLRLLDLDKTAIADISTTGTSWTDTIVRTGLTNYKPTGSSYTGAKSTVIESETVEVGYVYYYDGTKWALQAGGGGKVQDVQINGNTIVASGTGIANIPVMSNSTLGVAKTATTYGTNVNSDNILYIEAATDSEIASKGSYCKPIVPARLHTAIKEGLGNYSGTDFTTTEQTTARDTIDAAKKISVHIKLS